jgi:hypothetical protein
MDSPVEYRRRADQQRMAATSARLPMVRLMHKKAADRWEHLASEIERTEIFAPGGFASEWTDGERR